MHERRFRRLVRRAAEGDTRCFAKLYDLHVERVFGFIRLRVRDERDAEELTEAVFLKMYRALPGFEDRGVPFSAWLFKIARNELIDFTRRSQRSVLTSDAPEDLAAEACVDEEAFRRLEAEELRRAVESLTDEQAEVVIARFYWGLSVGETARAVGRTEGAVKALQHRAVGSLRRLLERNEADEQAV